MRSHTVELEAWQLADLRENGFCVAGCLTTAGELNLISRVFERLFSRAEQPANRDTSLWQIDMPVLEAPELVDTIFRANASQIARQVLGGAGGWVGEQALTKLPGGRETPWHQDEAYWSGDHDYDGLSIWLAIDRADENNGCLQFKSGSHRLEVLPHHQVDFQGGFPELEVDAYPAGPVIACPLEPGHATIHLSRTLHFAGCNHTNHRRRAYAMGFGAPPVKRTTSRNFYWLRSPS